MNGGSIAFPRRRAMLGLACALLLADALAAQGQFSVKKLGPLSGGNGSLAEALNESVQVAGYSYSSSWQYPTVWDDGAMTALPVEVALGDKAHGIDELGNVVGEANSSGSSSHSAALWTRSSSGTFTLEFLGTLYPYDISVATDLTDGAGLVVGCLADLIDAAEAAVWEPDVRADPPWSITALGWLSGDDMSLASAVNESGVVVGGSISGGTNHAVYWTKSGSSWQISQLSYLSGGFPSGFANDINDSGVICGYAYASGPDAHAVRWEGGSIVDLGMLGNDDAYALAVNGSGRVVGYAIGDAGARAFVSAGGGLVGLNTLLPPGSGWNLVFANDINDQNQIVGSGSLGGSEHSFLLTPVALDMSAPVPGTAGVSNTFAHSSLATNGTLYYSLSGGEAALGSCTDVPLNLSSPTVLATVQSGTTSTTVTLPSSFSGQRVYFQIAEPGACRVSDVVGRLFP